QEAIEYAHNLGKKVYVTVNIFTRDHDYEHLPEYILHLKKIQADAVIVSDPGLVYMIRKHVPDMEIHLSTQAKATNSYAAQFWAESGVKRIILARELTGSETREMIVRVKDMDIEMFVHGAMCMSYSGRCLLSNYLANRDSNRGMCTQPCRWKYRLTEEQRPGEYMPVFEDQHGTYIFNSKDLCLIRQIPEIIQMGVTSLKIEGRMKSAHYVGTVTSAYRQAIDAYCKDPDNYEFDPMWMEMLERISHRPYYTGFFYGMDPKGGQIHSSSTYVKEYDFIGLVMGYDSDKKTLKIEQRNKFSKGDEIEFHQPDGTLIHHEVKVMYNENMERVESAPHPQMTVYMPMDKPVQKGSMIRKIPV
ncbi:MAG TPA: peptidase U32, partial [Clostridiales bacterium]|nr:peptidase U32 [Clostridiales bacterium]